MGVCTARDVVGDQPPCVFGPARRQANPVHRPFRDCAAKRVVGLDDDGPRPRGTICAGRRTRSFDFRRSLLGRSRKYFARFPSRLTATLFRHLGVRSRARQCEAIRILISTSDDDRIPVLDTRIWTEVRVYRRPFNRRNRENHRSSYCRLQGISMIEQTTRNARRPTRNPRQRREHKEPLDEQSA